MTDAKPTSFDIAARAGVSQSTVSRALRGERSVSVETRARVRAVATQLNYIPDKNAASLRRGRSRTLALLFFEDASPGTSTINPFFLSMLGPILRACAREGYDLLTSFQQLSADWHVDFADSRKADGLILLGYGDYADFAPREADLLRQGTRFVRWGAAASEDGTTIGCDNFDGGRQAAAHLLARGRRRVAFLGDASEHYPEFQARYRGFVDGLALAGRPGVVARVDALSFDADGHGAARELLRGSAAVDAIFCASDMIAIGAMRALEEAGRRVPEDVAVIGFDDIPAAALSHPPLTTIAQDYHRAGEALVATLIARLDGRAPERLLLPPRLIVRDTA